MGKPEARPLIPPAVSFESLKGGELGRAQRVVPEGEVLSDDEKAERAENSMLKRETDAFIKKDTGLSPKEADDLADQWLKTHGAGDLVNPDLK